MKNYNIEIKDSVHDYIWELWEYIFRHSFDFETSKIVMENIYKEIFSLKIFPNRYPVFNDKYRVLTIDWKYRVFFIVDEENLNVIISRIFLSYENYLHKF